MKLFRSADSNGHKDRDGGEGGGGGGAAVLQGLIIYNQKYTYRLGSENATG